MKSIVKITTPAQSDLLTTAAKVRTIVGADVGENADLINVLIEEYSGVIKGYIGKSLGLQTLQQTFRNKIDGYSRANVYPFPYLPGYGVSPSGTEIQPLILRYRPVVLVISVTEDSNALIADVDYEYECETGFLWRLYTQNNTSVRGQWNGATIVVNYTAGYVLPQDSGTRTLPYDVENVVLQMIKSAYFTYGSDPSVILEITEGVGRIGYSPTRGQIFNDNMKTTLENYIQRIY